VAKYLVPSKPLRHGPSLRLARPRLGIQAARRLASMPRPCPPPSQRGEPVLDWMNPPSPSSSPRRANSAHVDGLGLLAHFNRSAVRGGTSASCPSTGSAPAEGWSTPRSSRLCALHDSRRPGLDSESGATALMVWGPLADRRAQRGRRWLSPDGKHLWLAFFFFFFYCSCALDGDADGSVASLSARMVGKVPARAPHLANASVTGAAIIVAVTRGFGGPQNAPAGRRRFVSAPR